jgi:hypothetical protein
MEISADTISKYVPYYLTQPQKDGLVKAMAEFPSCNYYSSLEHEGILQGDVWSGLQMFNFDSGERQGKRGIIISNSCDIDSRNGRLMPARMVFAPMIKISVYQNFLERRGVAQEKIGNHLREIRRQAVTSAFYLPQGRGMDEECIVFLDDMHNVPVAYFEKYEESKKILSLSQIGFYVFVMKLSMHFCRMHENEVRTVV